MTNSSVCAYHAGELTCASTFVDSVRALAWLATTSRGSEYKKRFRYDIELPNPHRLYLSPLLSTSVRPSPSHNSVPSSRLSRPSWVPKSKEDPARFLGGRAGSINRESDGDCEKYRFASAFAGSLSLLGNEGSSDSG